MRRRVKYIRYIPLILVVLGAVAALIINYYIEKDNKVLFSAVESSLNENEDGSFVITSTIQNKDDFPIEVLGCGFKDPRCDNTACDKVGILARGERFIVVIKCERGVNPNELQFSINSRRVGDTGQRTTTIGSPGFPNLGNLPFGQRPSRSGGSSGSNEGPSNTPGRGPGRIIGDLDSPLFIAVSGYREIPTIIPDSTPDISFEVPLPIGTSLSSMSCRWSNSDLAFNAMTSSCSINNIGEGLCTLPFMEDGSYNVYIACAVIDGNGQVVRQNNVNSNLDVSFSIDSLPIISRISPVQGTTFDLSVIAAHVTFLTDDRALCRAASGAPGQTPNSFAAMTTSCDPTANALIRSHDCLIPLNLEGQNEIRLACRDNNNNERNAGTYYWKILISSGGVVGTNVGTQIGGNDFDDGGGGGGSVQDVDGSTPPAEGGGNPDAGGDVVPGVGAVIRDFDSEHTLFEGIFNWFKGLFK